MGFAFPKGLGFPEGSAAEAEGPSSLTGMVRGASLSLGRSDAEGGSGA